MVENIVSQGHFLSPGTGRLTFFRKFEKGNPSSLAKDQICRDAVAISLMTAETMLMMIMAVMIFVAV